MHEQHRERMRERYYKHGMDGFSTHELLEILLYYAKARGDTNETAHLLLDQFGSLHGLFEADVEDLEEVEGIGPSSAILLKLIPELTRRYAEEDEDETQVFDSVSRLAEYFCRLYIGEERECVYLMLLNNKLAMIECTKIMEGSVNVSEVPVRLIQEKILRKKASSIVLAHNHPHGLSVPSSNDLQLTDLLNNSLNIMGVNLIEHLVIADGHFWPIMKQHCGLFRCSPVGAKKLDDEFYKKFYDVDESEWKAPPIFPPRKPREPDPS